MKSEALVQSESRLLAPYVGLHLFRNNRGAFKDDTGRVVRYGLANDSKQQNKIVKSADLIGWELYTVKPSDVGRTLPIFVSIECKPEDWKPPRSGDALEDYEAQLAWAQLVLNAGGRAQFVTDAEQLLR